jgi:hypothetical protein
MLTILAGKVGLRLAEVKLLWLLEMVPLSAATPWFRMILSVQTCLSVSQQKVANVNSVHSFGPSWSVVFSFLHRPLQAEVRVTARRGSGAVELGQTAVS